jgi:hypothetical protein
MGQLTLTDHPSAEHSRRADQLAGHTASQLLELALFLTLISDSQLIIDAEHARN